MFDNIVTEVKLIDGITVHKAPKFMGKFSPDSLDLGLG